MKKIFTLLFAIGLMFLLVSCGDVDDTGKGTGNSKVDSNSLDDRPAFIINMPDHFENLAWKCVGPNSVWQSTKGAQPVIVPNDMNCVGNTDNVQSNGG